MFNPTRISHIKFQTGNIVYIHLLNFQTFKNQEIYFGNNLNLIVAPNGTGKSSISNSIAFIFEEKPEKIVGKGNHLLEFIHFESDFCEVTCVVSSITHYTSKSSENKKNKLCYTSLKRKITAIKNEINNVMDIKDEFFIDNISVYKKKYYEFIATLCIDCSNLTNFLPQEKVTEFTKINGERLFREVFQKIKITTSHQSIIDIVDEFYEKKAELDKFQMDLENSTKELNLISNNKKLLEDELEKYYLFEKNAYQIQLCQYKENYIKMNLLIQEQNKLKNEISDLTKKIHEYNETISNQKHSIIELNNNSFVGEYNDKINKYKYDNELIDKIYTNLKEIVTNYKSSQNELKKRLELNCKINKENKHIYDKKQQQINQIKKEYNEYLKMIASIGLTVNEINIEQYLEKITNKDDLQLEFLNLDKIEHHKTTQISEIENTDNVYNKIKELKITTLKLQKEKEELEKERLSYKNERGQRLLLLKKFHLDTYKAVEWLQNNSIPVQYYEPIFLHINVDSNYQVEIESLFNFQCLTSFLVQSNDDIKTLSMLLKDNMKFNISISAVSTNTMRYKKDECFDGWAIDFVSCNPKYQTIYYSWLNVFGFNSIPITKNNISEHEILKWNKNIKKMVINQNLIEIKGNKYNDEIITRSVRCSNVLKLTSSKYTNDITLLDSQIQQYDIEREKIQKLMLPLLERKKAIELQIQTIEEKFRSIQEKYFILKRYISVYLNLSELPLHNTSDLLIEDIKKNFNTVVNKLFDIKLIPIDFNEFKKIEIEKLNIIRNIDRLEYEKNKSLDILNILNSRLKDEEKKRIEYEKVLSSIEQHITYPQRILSHNDTSSVVDYKAEINSLPETIEALMAKRFQLEGINKELDLNKNIRSQYIEQTNNYVKKQEEQKLIKHQISKLFETCKNIKTTVINNIMTYISPINNKFKTMFAKFDYAGEIRLNHTNEESENEINLGKFELELFVKFESKGKLEKLSFERHSGGEKSLSTILFLLALQDGTCGFRLVDEINQGMDYTNEKKVFELLNEVHGQFFMITPKLSDNFNYPSKGKILILYGGADTGLLNSY